MADYLGGRERAAAMLGKRYDIVRKALAQADEIMLWFDSCLYDMMLLRQFLCFAREELRQTRVWLVCEELRSDGSRFAGYAELDEREFKTMLDRRRSLTEPMMRDALESWRAFTSAASEAWRGLARREHQLAPFLAPAARRLLEQLPDESGLNRLEMEIMTALAAGCTQLPRLFEAVSAAKDRPFFGEAVVWQALNQSGDGRSPGGDSPRSGGADPRQRVSAAGGVPCRRMACRHHSGGAAVTRVGRRFFRRPESGTVGSQRAFVSRKLTTSSAPERRDIMACRQFRTAAARGHDPFGGADRQRRFS